MTNFGIAVDIVLTATIIALLLRIAVIDFKVQKIHNRDVLVLAGASTGLLVSRALQTDFLHSLNRSPWFDLKLSFAVAAILFILLFPFWMMRKVGAGDVKLMATAPLVAGNDKNLILFCFALLIFTIITAFAVRNPLLLPNDLFRKYMEYFERKGVVPFGVPISLSLVFVIIYSDILQYSITY